MGMTKKSPGVIRGFYQPLSKDCSDSGYVCGLKTFRPLDEVKSNPVAFGEGFEAVTTDSGKVDEYIVAIFLLEKTKTLAVIEPFYCTISHLLTFS
jgi:hypothetical protein